MSNKQRTKIRRNNYRGWKQAQKQMSATPASPAAPAPAVEPAEAAAAPQVAEPKISAHVNNPTVPDPSRPGASIPFNPSAPADITSLYERLRYGGPDVTDEERIAIARQMERHAANSFCGLNGPEEIEESRQRMRAMLIHALNRFEYRGRLPASLSWRRQLQRPATAPVHAHLQARIAPARTRAPMVSPASRPSSSWLTAKIPMSGSDWWTISTTSSSLPRARSTSWSTTWLRVTGSPSAPSICRLATSKTPKPSHSICATRPRIIVLTSEP